MDGGRDANLSRARDRHTAHCTLHTDADRFIYNEIHTGTKNYRRLTFLTDIFDRPKHKSWSKIDGEVESTVSEKTELSGG